MTSTYTIRTENARIIVSEDGVDCCRFASPAAALALAERLREVATSIQPPAADERCPVLARDGTRCLGDLGHEGKHWTAAGWFGREGDVERAR